MLQLLNFIVSTPYYYNNCIHNMGNIGPIGLLHACLAPTFTKIIDKKAYKGIDVRRKVYESLSSDSVLDLCCGTGFSTAPGGTGVDTSPEMLSVADIFNPGRTYDFGNAENYGDDKSFDYVTCMFAFHEMPNEAHYKIIENAKRIARNKVIIVDISTDYVPSEMMVLGEPYLLMYLQTIDGILGDFKKKTIIEGHVDYWEYNNIGLL